jgi:hypothetical protein
MEKEKIKEIVENVNEKTNKDLIESRGILLDEYTKTKELIIELTRHLEIVENYYEAINNEIGKRLS